VVEQQVDEKIVTTYFKQYLSPDIRKTGAQLQ
jgi:hypothetical protein